jgi:hypothetical protein
LGRGDDGDHTVPVLLGGMRSPGQRAARRFLHAVRPDTLRARPNTPWLAVDQHADALQVRIPPSRRLVVRVADVVTGSGSFATDVAHSGHGERNPLDDLRMRNLAAWWFPDKACRGTSGASVTAPAFACTMRTTEACET